MPVCKYARTAQKRKWTFRVSVRKVDRSNPFGRRRRRMRKKVSDRVVGLSVWFSTINYVLPDDGGCWA
jgi:hypothetical protein